MWNLVRACAALAIAGTAMAPAAFAEGGGSLSTRTVSDLYDDWTEQAATIETAGTAAQRQGDAALAQQEFLLSAMIRRATAEFRNAEQYSLTVKIADLPAPLPERVAAAAPLVSRASSVTDSTVGSILDEARSKLNALVAPALGDKRYPVLYGMLSRDLARDPAAEPADLVIYGLDIVDPFLKKMPIVRVGSTELPESAVSVKNNILMVALPEEVKKQIGFAPSPCDDRKTFRVRVRSFYAETRGFWPLQWKTEQASIADFDSLSTPTVYTATLSYSFDHPVKTVATQTFDQRSSFVAADCEQKVSTALTIELPAGAHDATCEAQWVDTSSARSAQANCHIENTSATARGTLSGEAKVCSYGELCSCISTAHGWLEAKGSYKHDVENIASLTQTSPDVASFAADTSTSAPLTLPPTETLTAVSVAFARRACPVALDSLDIAMPDGQAPLLPTPSRTGAFRAKFGAGRLLVGSASADAFNVAPSQ